MENGIDSGVDQQQGLQQDEKNGNDGRNKSSAEKQ
jgi:hypothetical protein